MKNDIISMNQDKQYTYGGLLFASYAAAVLAKKLEAEQKKVLPFLDQPITTMALYMEYGEALPEHQ